MTAKREKEREIEGAYHAQFSGRQEPSSSFSLPLSDERDLSLSSPLYRQRAPSSLFAAKRNREKEIEREKTRKKERERERERERDQDCREIILD